MAKLLFRFVYLLFLAVITFSLILSCTPSNKESQINSEDCLVIQHGMGETCVPQTPQRFIALNPAALGNAIALGIKPVGSVVESDNQFPDYLKNETGEIEPLGNTGQPSLEQIALLKPDIAIGWKHNYQSLYPQLSEITPTVLYPWKTNNKLQDNWKQYFNFVAKVLGKQETAREVWQQYDRRIEQLKTALGDRYKGKTISVIIFCCGGINSEVENSFIGSVLSDVGLQRPESQRYNLQGFINISEETLEMADGDVMFVIAYGGNETGERDLNLIQQKPLWQNLKAVRQDRVYYVDPTTWRGRTPLAADAVLDDLEKYLVEQ